MCDVHSYKMIGFNSQVTSTSTSYVDIDFGFYCSQYRWEMRGNT